MDFEGRSLKAQMSLADRLQASFVVILGERELEKGAVQVRPMRKLSHQSGDEANLTEAGRLPVQQEEVPFEELVAYLLKKINSEGSGEQ